MPETGKREGRWTMMGGRHGKGRPGEPRSSRHKREEVGVGRTRMKDSCGMTGVTTGMTRLITGVPATVM